MSHRNDSSRPRQDTRSAADTRQDQFACDVIVPVGVNGAFVMVPSDAGRDEQR
jgi:hypothetical protein